ALRMARGLGSELPKILQLLHRQRVAGEIQHRIEQHGRMAVREYETVTIPPSGVPRIELKYIAPENLCDVSHAHGSARMARMSLLDGVHGQGTNGVGEFAAGGHGGLLLEERAEYCPRCAVRQQYRDTGPVFGGTRSHNCSLSMYRARSGAPMTQFTVS